MYGEINDWDKENIGVIMGGYGDWFTARLLRLMQKADPINMERMRMGFPDEVAAYEDWMRSEQ